MTSTVHHAGVETIGHRINAARRAAGITAAELGRRAGLSKSYIGMLETDKREPTVPVVAKIAQALGVDPCELAFGGVPDRVGKQPESQKEPD